MKGLLDPPLWTQGPRVNISSSKFWHLPEVWRKGSRTTGACVSTARRPQLPKDRTPKFGHNMRDFLGALEDGIPDSTLQIWRPGFSLSLPIAELFRG